MDLNPHFLTEVDAGWTLFLDRDGVINRKIENDYVKSLSEFDLLPGVLEAFYRFDQRFYKIIVVTNQQGIGKGLMTHENLHWIHNFLIEEVRKSNGELDAIFYCPHLQSDECLCRKPAPGMALQAKENFKNIDFSKSIIIGDSFSDMEFGRSLGMKTVFCGKAGGSEVPFDLRVDSLIEFARLLESYV